MTTATHFANRSRREWIAAPMVEENEVILEVVEPDQAAADAELAAVDADVPLEVVDVRRTARRRGLTIDDDFEDRYRTAETAADAITYWLQVVAGVTVAGTLYGLPFLIIGAVFGFCIAGAVSCLLVIPFAMSVRTLAGTWRHPLAGPAFGGIVGFVSTAPIWDELSSPNAPVLFLLGPMVTTAMGQAGGFLASRSFAMDAGARRWRQARATGSRIRFSMLFLMIATAWIAVALTALRAAGLLEPPHVKAIAFWLPWQFGLLWLWSQAGRYSRGSRFT